MQFKPILSIIIVALIISPSLSMAGVPVIYSTDLYHPHDDPDDHFDLVTLFALPEVDVKGIIIDMSNFRQKRGYHKTPKQPGIVALQQVFHLTGKSAPYALGLETPLRSTDDKALDLPQSRQGGVEMILSTLRESKERVNIFVVGSLVDVAAAYNREPDLMRDKVRAVYVNAGTGPDGWQEEWNVRLDQKAYQRVMLSDLPIEWYPCFGRNNYYTYFRIKQSEVLADCSKPLLAFFEYALTRSASEPISFLAGTYAPPKGSRNMWSTASFFDLAGRKIYKTSKGYQALRQPPTPGSKPVVCYNMRPVQLSAMQEAHIPPATGVYARYEGMNADLIGKNHMKPDGTNDCLVRVHGLTAGKVACATLRGPRIGKWLSYPNPKHWRVGTNWENDYLAVYFSYWKNGRHRLELEFENGKTERISFHVPLPNSPRFRANLSAPSPRAATSHTVCFSSKIINDPDAAISWCSQKP
jgi:Inosine-uridine preferring nucleoside hydrolase